MHLNKRRLVYILLLVVFLAILVYGGISQGLFESIPDMMSIKLNIHSIFQLVIMVVMVLIVTMLALFILGLAKPVNNRASTMVSMVSSIIKYVSAFVILCWGLTIIGVNVTTVVASVGILTLVIGFGAESLIADVISGVFMIFENQYNVGDIVEVNNFRGIVRSIGIRTTAIEDAGGNIKIINNSNMTNILNRSDKYSLTFCTVGIAYDTDLEALEEKLPQILEDIYENNREFFHAVPCYDGVEELADSAVVLRFSVEVEEENIYIGRRLLNREILLAVKKAGVEIPYPQLDIHRRS